ncbi:thiol oxidase [Aureococcus anophagefferens]|nr:thiol oxidase [Aureococcus anophagefferens]
MRRLLCLGVFAAVDALGSDKLFLGASGVRQLDRSGVRAVAANETDAAGWVVAFYAPWCGHCQHYAPSFRQFGAALAASGDALRAGAVSCTAEKKACSEFGVRSYPTVKAGAAEKGGGLRAEDPPLKTPGLRGAPALSDAAASLRYALESAVFTEGPVLSRERLVALRGVLAAASTALPGVAVAPALLDSKAWSAATRRPGAESGGTYTCGLWSFFHAVVASEALEPRAARAAVRAFVAHFFARGVRSHFLAMYDACDHGACDADGDASLWLWRAHNAVNSRVKGGGASDAAAAATRRGLGLAAGERVRPLPRRR